MHVGPSPHLFGEDAPQVFPLGHGPQLIKPPHLSPMFPHSAPSALQLVGMHASPHLFGPLPPHTPPFAHDPQLMAPPQPSLTQPQLMPLVQACCSVFGVHVGCPQMFGAPPPPHVSGDVHDPQLSVPPQPSATRPQLFAFGQAAAWLRGVQVF